MRPSYRKVALVFLVLVALFAAGCSNDSNPINVNSTEQPTIGKAAPAGYYNAVDAGTPAALRSSLHEIVDDHVKIPYTATGTDTWNVVELADQDPADSGRVLDVYLNASFPKYGAGNLDYNREHSWAKSYGFPTDGATNYPYTDCHHLFICNDSYNSSRSNKPYGTVGAGTTEYVTQVNGGVGGGSGVYPGWSNWANTTYWETWQDRRGDVARALFYMDVRYAGGTHGVSGYTEPDLILTDNLALIEASNTGSNETTAYMGLLSSLLQWHLSDPVDAKEMARNDAVYMYQGNRNPFIDHPEWVDCVFLGTCGGGGDVTPPAAPTGLVAVGGSGSVNLDWNDNAEGDLAGYTVYRATLSGGPYSAVSGGLLTASTYNDGTVTGGTTYWYHVTASDASSNMSAASSTASATPTGGGGGAVVWINEFHYDNDGTDTGEFVEVAGSAGTSLAGWSVVGYNGSGGAVYATVALSGTLPNQLSGYGTASFAFAGMQNGSPDGLALVDGTGQVVQFLSYEGSFTAVGGAANGMVSTDIVVSESTTSPVGWTLQLAGNGTTYAAFTWQAPAAGTSGAVNTGQSFGGGVPNVPPTAVANGPYAGLTGQAIAFSSAGSSDSDGTIVAWLWAFGDGATSTAANPSHAYATAGPYTATLTVTDDDSAQHATTAGVQITAPNVPPTAVANGPYTGLTGQAIAFSSAGSSDSDGTIVAWHWAFGDGATSTAANPSHAYATAGPYTATLTVTDNDSAQHATTAGVQVNAPPPATANVWINEFHYDNTGTDADEFVEVAGPAGTVLTGWTVVAYNGSGGASYLTKSLSGTITNKQNGFGVVSITFAGLQNGSPDGLALVDNTGKVVQFLSYEGSFTATNGPAAGLVATDIGISEPETAPKRTSLQLRGTGTTYAQFTWYGGLAKSNGSVNTGQVFAAAKIASR